MSYLRGQDGEPWTFGAYPFDPDNLPDCRPHKIGEGGMRIDVGLPGVAEEAHKRLPKYRGEDHYPREISGDDWKKTKLYQHLARMETNYRFKQRQRDSDEQWFQEWRADDPGWAVVRGTRFEDSAHRLLAQVEAYRGDLIGAEQSFKAAMQCSHGDGGAGSGAAADLILMCRVSDPFALLDGGS